jgi:glycosyltransferase involved in cell wall biosynthesis
MVRNCRGSRAEALAYGASLALWQQRLIEQADAFIVPSEFARERLRELGAPLDWERVHVLPPPVRFPEEIADAKSGSYALVVSRLAPEKGVDVAVEACQMAGVPLVLAGDGPERENLEAQAGHCDLHFLGHVADAELANLRRGAALAIVPSRSAETFGMAAGEAMAAGVPVVASRIGALPELVEQDGLVDPGDVTALAEAIARRWRDAAAAARGRARVQELCAPAAVAAGLAAVYGESSDRGANRATGRQP